MAVWSLTQDNLGDPAARRRMAIRRAVARHLALAEKLSSESGPAQSIALDHLELAERIGIDLPEALVTWAGILARLDLEGGPDAGLDRALALAPRDDRTLGKVAIAWARSGRFRGAGAWYSRMSSLPPCKFTVEWIDHGVALVLAGDHARYRQHCAVGVRRLESHQDPELDASDVAYISALGPASTVDADERIRIAQRGYDAAEAAPDTSRHFWARMALGAAYVRAGAPARAEPLFRETFKYRRNWELQALNAAWMAIATWHQGRGHEAKTWLDQAARTVAGSVPGVRPELEHLTPWTTDFKDWGRLLIAWREAQGLILDADFPADPFAP